MTRAILVSLMVFAVGWPPLPAQRAMAQETPLAVASGLNLCDEGEGTGGISGKVTRADTGDPVGGAEIRISTIYGKRMSPTGSRFTDEDGLYELTDLPAGTYVVRVWPEFHDPADDSSLPNLSLSYYDGQATAETFTPVEVTDDQITRNIDFSLQHGGLIRGRITHADSSQPVNGRAWLYGPHTSGWWFDSQRILPEHNGYYTFTVGLPPGEYVVNFLPDYRPNQEQSYYDGKDTFASADVVKIVGAETYTANMVIPLIPPKPDDEVQPFGEIRGSITLEENGQPVLAQVMAYDADGESAFSVADISSDLNGRYFLRVPPGTYHIKSGAPSVLGGGVDRYDFAPRFYGASSQVDAAEAVTVAADEVLDDIDIALERGARISGRVINDTDGTGVGRATVAATIDSEGGFSRYLVGVQADSSGYYTLPAVTPGVYTVSTGNRNPDCRYIGEKYGEPIAVNGVEPIPNINLVARQGAFITGRITADETGAGSGGVIIHALKEGAELDPRFWFRTAETGHYRIGPLAPDRYQILYVPHRRTGLGQVYHGNTTERENAPFIDLAFNDILTDMDVVLIEAIEEPDDPTDSSRIYLPALRR